jgi:hypothetical protein
VSAWNLSVPGEKLGDVAVRQGGLALQFAVPGGVIPASTARFAVTLASPSASEFSGSAVPEERFQLIGKGTGVDLDVRFDGTSWTAARVTAAATSKPVPASGLFFRASNTQREAILVSFGGATAAR